MTYNMSTGPNTKLTYDADSYANVLPDKSVHQHADRIFHQPHYRYDELERFGCATLHQDTLSVPATLQSGTDVTLRVQALDATVLRLQLFPPARNS